MFIPSICFSQISIDSLYNINPKSSELNLSLRKYEKQDNFGRILMGAGIVGMMTSRIVIYNLKNIDENRRYNLYRANFLILTPISLYGVYNLFRAPRHVKKHLYLY